MNTAFIRVRLRSGRSQVGIRNMTKKKLPFDLVEIWMLQPQKNTADPVVALLTMILTADIQKEKAYGSGSGSTKCSKSGCRHVT
jgi:hypothetical protein